MGLRVRLATDNNSDYGYDADEQDDDDDNDSDAGHFEDDDGGDCEGRPVHMLL